MAVAIQGNISGDTTGMLKLHSIKISSSTEYDYYDNSSIHANINLFAYSADGGCTYSTDGLGESRYWSTYTGAVIPCKRACIVGILISGIFHRVSIFLEEYADEVQIRVYSSATEIDYVIYTFSDDKYPVVGTSTTNPPDIEVFYIDYDELKW